LTDKWKNDTIFKEMFYKEPILQRYYLTFIENKDVIDVVSIWGAG
jgi:hypothetical protein